MIGRNARDERQAIVDVFQGLRRRRGASAPGGGAVRRLLRKEA